VPDESEKNLNQPQKRDIQWFFNHSVISSFFLADWLSETFDEWKPMREELAQLLEGGKKNGSQNTTETV
jgi:hypothetical protein